MTPWFASGHTPSILSSPSLRGTTFSFVNNQRRPSPFSVDVVQNKRRRAECDHTDEESSSTGLEQRQSSPSVADEEQQVTTPILGQLRSDSEVDSRTDSSGDGKEGSASSDCEDAADRSGDDKKGCVSSDCRGAADTSPHMELEDENKDRG
jgi:hypothetical protein